MALGTNYRRTPGLVGPGGCEIGRVVLLDRVCRRKAAESVDTGKVKLMLCRKCAARCRRVIESKGATK